ncbi:MAG: hypothetical protein KY445_00590 [Armatimonadetes bacterium]|nr:hypothetical protein [Armatimonadota bacterium]
MNRFFRSDFLPTLALPLLMLIVAGFAWEPLGGGDDFWAHASIGRWILENGQIPRQTLFLWSESIPWIAHAWATGLVFAFLMRVGGESGGPYLAQILNLILCAAPFVLLWRFWRRRAPFASLMAPLFVLAIWVSSARFHPRPELFTALFLTLLFLFLIQWPQQKALPKLQIAGVVLMFAVWPNFHGAVAVGLVILWLSAFCELLQTRRDGRLLLLAATCTLLVFLCNPRGFEYLRVLLPIGSATFKRIDEWKPFWQWPQLATALVVGEILLWAIGMTLWLANPNRRWAQLGWMLLMMAAFLSARRQLWLTALTSLSVIVSNARPLPGDELFRGWRKLSRGDASQPLPAPMRLIGRVGVLVILLCALAQAVSKDDLAPRAVKANLPVGMTAFLLDKAPPGRIMNDYEFSAYLQWGLHERRLLYIDLNNAYPDYLMNEYFHLINGSKDRARMVELDERRYQILARRKINVVALRPFSTKEGLSNLARYLEGNTAWRRIYVGIDGTVWARG